MSESSSSHVIIYLSSSCDDEEEADEGTESDEQSVDDTEDEEISKEDEPEPEVSFKRVMFLLKERKALEGSSLKECKAYLRQHGLRLSGTKSVCLQRIKDHWSLKDGNGASLYPRSSFSINCTGDVCKGDVVLFTQKVYEKFDKVTRHGNLLGTRTVASRVVKESYGSAKQQHTFTVEVLWSKGVKKLQPLFPLLVKGRNLYKLKTFRQRWNNEAERVGVLAEKHKRGTAARFTRAVEKSRKRSSASVRGNAGLQRPKMGKNEKREYGYGHKNDTLHKHANAFNRHGKGPPSTQLNLNGNVGSGIGSRSTWRHSSEAMDPTLHAYAYTGAVPLHFSVHEMGSTSTLAIPASSCQYMNHINTHHDHSHPSYSFGRGNLSHFHQLTRPIHHSYHGKETCGQWKKSFH